MSTVAVTSGLGALPSRFRRERLLIVGYGDVGQRMARNLLTGPGAQRLRVLALTSQAERVGSLRAQGRGASERARSLLLVALLSPDYAVQR